MAQFGLIHRLSLLHTKDMRREHLVWLVVVFYDFLGDDFIIGKDGHGNRARSRGL